MCVPVLEFGPAGAATHGGGAGGSGGPTIPEYAGSNGTAGTGGGGGGASGTTDGGPDPNVHPVNNLEGDNIGGGNEIKNIDIVKSNCQNMDIMMKRISGKKNCPGSFAFLS